MTTRNEVSAFLTLFKLSIEFDRWHFKDRERTEQDLVNLNLNKKQAADIISLLTPNHYVSGPMPDDIDFNKEVWVFGYKSDLEEIYIKLRLTEAGKTQFPRALIWSFHKAKHRMKYPLKLEHD